MEEWPTDDAGWLVHTSGKSYRPHRGQQAFHDNEAAIKLLVGGRGAGKTTSGAQEAGEKIAEGQDGLIVAPDYKHFKKSTWPQLNEWIPIDPELTGLPTSPLVEYWSRGDQYVRFITGATVWYGGIKEPDSWRGPNVNWVWYDEPGRHPMRESFLVLIGCMRIGEDVSMFLTTTPRGMAHWLYPVFVERDISKESLRQLERAGLPGDPNLLLGMERASTFDNRDNLNPVYLAFLMELYQGKWREQELEGKFVSFQGLVYGDVWDPEVHMVDRGRFKIEPWWPKYRVIDFGYRNPFVCGWWAQTPDGDFVRYREIYMTGRTVNHHARDINRYSEHDGNIVATICDWDAEDRATLEEHGITTEPAVKDVMRGIETVYRYLYFDENTKPRLYYVRDALVETDPALVANDLPTCTEEEYPRYSWPEDRDGKPRKEQPIKLHDHGMDMTRYLVASVEGLDDVGIAVGTSPIANYRG